MWKLHCEGVEQQMVKFLFIFDLFYPFREQLDRVFYNTLCQLQFDLASHCNPTVLINKKNKLGLSWDKLSSSWDWDLFDWVLF